MSLPETMGMAERIEGHTLKRFDGELSHLHYLVLEMGGLVIAQVREALAAFKSKDLVLARTVIDRDDEVDRLEIETDGEIVKLLARRCPVGSDLRLVIAVSKSVSDLERIGDEAIRIAELVSELFGNETGDPDSQLVRDVHVMGAMALSSLQSAVGLLDDWSEEKALGVIDKHREMDDEFRSDLRRLITFIMEDSRNIGAAISVVSAIRSLERIGHHSQNLAEYFIFLIRGENVPLSRPGP